jgi:phosphoribosyl 1,2-cyclic phosphate phosphodiesterase
MQIKALGTAASEGWPAIFCECETCKKARQNRGKDLRSRTSYLINGELLVDLGPDIYFHDTKYGFFTQNLKTIVITHTHEDHYNPDEFFNRCQYMSIVKKNIDLVGTEQVFSKFENYTGKTLDKARLRKNIIVPWETIKVNGIEIIALRAAHQTRFQETCLNYVFIHNNKSILIANDTGWWDDETWEFVRRFKFNIAFIDSTVGLNYKKYRTGHMSADIVVEFRDRLNELGCIDDKSKVYANHFSHNGGGSHAELCNFFEPQGIGVAFDGIKVDID